MCEKQHGLCSWRPFLAWMQFVCGSHNFMFRCNSDFGIDLAHQKSFYVITILELILSVPEIFLCHFDFGSDITNHRSCYVILILVLISLTRHLDMPFPFWYWTGPLFFCFYEVDIDLTKHRSETATAYVM